MTRADRPSQALLRAFLLVLILWAGGLALPVGVTWAAVTAEQELQAGRRVAAALEARLGRLSDAPRLARVSRVGRRLEAAAGRRPGSISFRLLDASEFNALALPGGIVYVTRGLVDAIRSDDELAAALAHEMAHLTLGHTRDLLEEDYTRAGSAGEARRVKAARQKELDADRASIPMMARAGFRTEAVLTLLEHLRGMEAPAEEAETPREPETASHHPTAAERIRAAGRELSRLGVSGRPTRVAAGSR